MSSTNAHRRTRFLAPAVVSGAVQWDMRSKGSDRMYRVYVRAPTTPPPAAGYPVIYFTDGNLTFPIAAMLAEFIESESSYGPPLIVGIGYPVSDLKEAGTLRAKDLTSAGPGERMIEEFFDHLRDIPCGGSQEFYGFLTQQLHPKIAGMYRVDPGNRSLCGHSLGGLFALDTLFRHAGEFRTFVAGSPAIWWNEKAILREVGAFRSTIETAQAGPRVLIIVGSMEQSATGLPTPPQMTRNRFQQLLRLQRWVDNARELASELASIRSPAGYRVEFHVFEGETHGSMIGTTVSRGMRFAMSP